MHLRNRVNGTLPPEVLLSSCEVRAGGSVLKAELPGDRAAASPWGAGYEAAGAQWKTDYGGTLSSFH